MKKIWMLSLVALCTGCPLSPNNVKKPGQEKPKHYYSYISKCKEFPYPDSIYVDPCFEFDCNVRKFLVWDHTCKDADQANAMIDKDREHYGKLEDYR